MKMESGGKKSIIERRRRRRRGLVWSQLWHFLSLQHYHYYQPPSSRLNNNVTISQTTPLHCDSQVCPNNNVHVIVLSSDMSSSIRGPSRLFCSWQFAILLGLICGSLLYVNVIMTHVRSAETSGKLSKAEEARLIDQQNARDFKNAEINSEVKPKNEEPKKENNEKMEEERKEEEAKPLPVPPKKTQKEQELDDKSQLWMIAGNGPDGSIFKNEQYPERCKKYNSIFENQTRAELQFPHVDTCPRWSSWMKKIRECILSELPTTDEKIWEGLHETIVCCVSEFRNLLSAMPLFGKDDLKLIVLPMDLTDPCRVVTLGVGNDISVEEKLKKAQEQCEFYGADPNSNYTDLFENVGDMHEMAVSGTGGDRSIFQLNAEGNYVKSSQPVSTVSLDHFLDKVIHQNEIDYLFMDIEGSEYTILPEFFKGKSMHPDESSSVICQLTVELHGPLQKYDLNAKGYREMLEQFFDESPFIPIWGPKPGNHQRLFLINGESDYCIQKFHVEWCPEIL